MFRRCCLCLLAFVCGFGAPAFGVDQPALIRVTGSSPAQEALLVTAGVPVYAKLSGWMIAEADQAQMETLRGMGLDFTILDENPWQQEYYLVPAQDLRPGEIAATILSTGPDFSLVRVPQSLRFNAREHREVIRLTRSPLPFPQSGAHRSSPARFPSRAGNPFIQALVDSVSSDSVYSYIGRLQDFQTRFYDTDSVAAAATWLYQKLQSFGVDSVAYDSFYAGGRWGMNVVGTKRGQVLPEHVLIICAHYDSYSWDPYNHAPGADDNASGTAAVLEAARVMAPFDYDGTVKFICFSGEEMGLWGSQHYAAQASASGMDIGGVLNFDMIGYQNDSLLDVIIYTDSLGQALADFETQIGNEYTSLVINNSHQNSSGSDHWYFQQYGFEAAFVIEDGAFNPNYHSPSDFLSTLSMPFARETARLGVAALAVLALTPTSPQGLNAIPVRAGGALDLSWQANPEPDLSGYRIYYGTAPGSYGPPVDVGDIANYRLGDLVNGTSYYVALTAYDNDGWESQLTPEILAMPALLSMDQGILLVDETHDGTGSPVTQPSDAQQDSFYANILHDYYFTEWDCAQHARTPNLMDLGTYSTVIWHADDYLEMLVHQSLPWLSEYLDAGGNLWLVGWKPLYALMLSGSYPYSFGSGVFPYDYLHLFGGDDSRRNDFTGAAGYFGYPSLTVDTSKTTSQTGRLSYVDTTIPWDGEIVYTFQSATADTLFQGRPCGVRHLSPDHNTVILGFPLYFIEEHQAHILAERVLSDFGEVPGIQNQGSGIRGQGSARPFLSCSPSPFSHSTTIRFTTPATRTAVTLNIYNITGQVVRSFRQTSAGPGMFSVPWDGADQTGRKLANGIYVCRLEAGPVSLLQRVVLIH